MTMPESETITKIKQMADTLFKQAVTLAAHEPKDLLPAAEEASKQRPPEPLAPKPAAVAEPAFLPSPDYYFLSQNPAQKQGKPAGHRAPPAYDPATVRRDFPILAQKINGKPLVWLDNAATTQKPLVVIDALTRYYREYNSNVHRGVHTLADRATEAYETARKKTAAFIGAATPEEIVFVRGTTEAINLVAQAYGPMIVGKGDEILISEMEHHSNIIPWQLLARTTGAKILRLPITDRSEVDLVAYERLLARRPKIVAITEVSNVLGTINPVRLMTEMAHYYGALVLVDGAQAVPHFPVDVRESDADFYAFSGHKIYGPTGIGVLYGKKALLEETPPWQGGGNMIKEVSLEEASYNTVPHKFEAGTANIADAVGLGAALDYLQKIGMAQIARHEQTLTAYALERLAKLPGLCLIGTAPHKAGVISFTLAGHPSLQLAKRLNKEGIAVRAGHHCAQPLLHRYGLKDTVRISLGLYNTEAEMDFLVKTLERIIRSE